MGILDILKSLVLETKKINVSKLPSQGLFYNEDFEIRIKKATIEDIIEYEHRYDRNNLISAIECIKRIVKKNVVLSNNYTYDYIKSVDIIFIFLEIVKFTNKKKIEVSYINSFGKEDYVTFDEEHFKYFDFTPYLKFYNSDKKEIEINGYRFSLPSIGVETALTSYLSTKNDECEAKKLSKVSYDFMFFLGNKSYISNSEIDNLISIFNYDLDEVEISKIKNIVDRFKGIVGYTLMIDGKEVEMKSKINLPDIFKV